MTTLKKATIAPRIIDELLVAAEEFDSQHLDDGGLEAYLEQSALVNETDAWDSVTESVTLMTLHAAKGLEFPIIYIIGLEDGLLPHERSSVDDEEIEEERRLLFVGITRAKKELQLSRAMTRFRRGQFWPTIASRFLMELPREEMDVFEPAMYEFNEESDIGREPWDEEPWVSESTSEEISAEPTDQTELGGSQSSLEDRLKAKMFTASDMLKTQGHSEAGRLPPDAYHVGLLVEHESYGPGKVNAVSGYGKKMVATVAFF